VSGPLDAHSEARYLLPIFSHRGIDQLRIAVTLVRSDFFTNPLGKPHRLTRVLQFDFSKDETCVFSLELVHLPEDSFMEHLIAGLLDQRTAAELEHFLCFLHGYLILELGSDNPIA
jgi:hypothetical protein